MSINNTEKVVAVVLVTAALLFVAYSEVSNGLTGAYLYKNALYMNCKDSDGANLFTQGTVTVEQVDIRTGKSVSTAVKVDQCLGARLEEWGCTPYNKPKVIKKVYCPKGMICRDGACV